MTRPPREVPSPEPPPPYRPNAPQRHPLRQRTFRLLFTGRTLSALGDAAVPAALAIAISRAAGSASALALVLGCAMLPRLLLPVGGVLGDRLDPSYDWLLSLAAMPVGYALAPVAAHAFGPAVPLYVCAALVAAACVGTAAFPGVRGAVAAPAPGPVVSAPV